MTDSKQHIAVAVSGGGHRAGLFALGALLYLVDAGKGPELSTISSVSGGSITNAYLGASCDLTTATSTEVWDAAKTVGARFAVKGTLWASPLTYVLLSGIGAAVLAPVVVARFEPGGVTALAAVSALVVAGALAQCRSLVAAHAFARTLFPHLTLESMKPAVSHVLCATDLDTSESVYFSDRFIHSWRTGWRETAHLSLARAVQASAALPGAFNTVSLRGFKLTDGGVYDNMATEWPLRLHRRLEEASSPEPTINEIDEVVVVNASAGRGVVSHRSLRWPLLGEVASLLAVKDVLYDQTTAVRRRLLDLRYRIARVSLDIPDGALAGTTVQIDRSPFELPKAFGTGNDERAARAQAVLAHLGGGSEREWQTIADQNRAVKTTLSRIGLERSAAIVRQAYVLTMANCHVLLDYPLIPIPDGKTFQDGVT